MENIPHNMLIVSKAPGIDCSDISKMVAFEQFGYACLLYTSTWTTIIS